MDKNERVFSYSELFGPFSCDVCGEECWYIVVSEEERNSLPENRYEASCKAINMGKAVCIDHLEDALSLISPKGV